MNIRFTDVNWSKFATANKSTTWRTTRRKDGIYNRVRGSFYKPIPTGEKLEIKFLYSKKFCELTEEDAIADGFPSLVAFKSELCSLAKRLLPDDMILYCHSAKIIVEIDRKHI